MKTKQQKREEALARQELRNKLTARQQLNLLDKKFGKDTGATKERLKLMELIKYDAGDKPKKDVPEKVKVKKGEDPLKAKKKARREAKRKE
jgi:hypothetical protein